MRIPGDTGETVIVTGNIHVEAKDGNKKARPVSVLYAHSIDYLGKMEQELSEEDIQELKDLKAQYGDNIISGFLVPRFAPHVVGNLHSKEAMLMVDAMAGIPNNEDESNYERYRIHQLLIGDPGEAKGRLLWYNAKVVPGGRYESAQSSTGLSLTAVVEKEKDRCTVRVGSIPLARGSVCTLNEIDKMRNMDEHKHFLDTMEEGHFTVNKYGRHFEIPANTSIKASANPINNTWNHHDRINMDEIPVIEQNRQRFDIISIFREPKSSAERTQYIWEKREVERNHTAGMYKDYARLIRNWLKYVRSLPLPTIDKEAQDMLDNYACKLEGRGFKNDSCETKGVINQACNTGELKLKGLPRKAPIIILFYSC